MSLSIGLVGLPNAGKSTLFNALLQKHQAKVARHPFTTINPNIGIIEVPDKRLKQIAKIVGVNKIIPSTLKIIDIAGLVRGAHRGHGLGNQFLSEINRVDLIAVVIRFFEHSNISHPENNLHPGNDFQTILTELTLKDMETIIKAQQRLEKQIKIQPDRKTQLALKVLETISQQLNAGHSPRLETKQKELIKDIPLLTLKPMIFIANCSEAQLPEADELVQNFCPAHSQQSWIYLDASAENQMIGLSAAEKNQMREVLNIGPDKLEELVRQSFLKLKLITFFTYNKHEARAWQIVQNSTARQASRQIHEDFFRLFIRAQVIDFDTFIRTRNEQKAKQLGVYRTEGENYKISDGEIINFVVNKK